MVGLCGYQGRSQSDLRVRSEVNTSTWFGGSALSASDPSFGGSQVRVWSGGCWCGLTISGSRARRRKSGDAETPRATLSRSEYGFGSAPKSRIGFNLQVATMVTTPSGYERPRVQIQATDDIVRASPAINKRKLKSGRVDTIERQNVIMRLPPYEYLFLWGRREMKPTLTLIMRRTLSASFRSWIDKPRRFTESRAFREIRPPPRADETSRSTSDVQHFSSPPNGAVVCGGWATGLQVKPGTLNKFVFRVFPESTIFEVQLGA